MRKMNLLRFTLWLALGTLALIIFKPIWVRLLSSGWNTIMFLIIFAFVFTLVVLLCMNIYALFVNGNFKYIRSYIPMIFIALTACEIRYSPMAKKLEGLYGRVNYEACRKGTQSRSTFKLRNNHRFEIHHTGVFFHEEYELGEYFIRNDTLELKYNGKQEFRKMAIIRRETGVTIFHSDPPSRQGSVYFYEGKCKNDS